MPSKILFVNKSAKSKHLTRSDGIERSKIFRHVQHSPYGSSEKTSPSRSSVSTISSPDSTYATDYSSDDSIAGAVNRTARQSKHEITRDLTSEERRAIVMAYSPISLLSTSKIDPFDCAIVPMDAYMTDMLKLYRKNLVETVFQVRPWAEGVAHYHLKYASENGELLYAMLCSASGTSYAMSQDPRHLQSAIGFKGQALSHLRRSVDRVKRGERPSVATIFAIAFHVYLECINGEIEVAQLHYGALERCMANVPVENIPLTMRVGMMVPSFFVSGMLSRPPIKLPIFETPDEDSTHSFEDELLATGCPTAVLDDAAGVSFLHSASQAVMGSRLCQIINDIRSTQTDPSQTPKRDNIRETFTTRNNIEYELLSLPFDLKAITAEQDVVRLALYLSCKPTLTSSPFTDTLNNTMASQIYASLQRSVNSNRWRSCPKLLLWALFVAAAVSTEDEQRAWIIRQIKQVKDVFGLRSQEEIEAILSGFFFPHEHFADGLDAVWSELVVSRR